ncbi:MAG: DNA topoisomerase VI subunit B [Methanomassiliicoccales archaeon]|jgi:DNA topoisomerase-6 subunit B|nr:DNA topoisomerase VI subunit B [Methanomassiliicoccales archaeon]
MASIAEQLAKKQREISVSEFFERNRQILGFDSPTKSLLMAVKEAVDNSLDACEEASILPEIIVDIRRTGQNEFKITVEDNGPGIVPKVIPNVFGKLLYGSRFHSLRQARGQQGIGISAAVLYSQMTTGRPAIITSKTEKDEPAAKMEIKINTRKNEPDVLSREFIIWDEKEHGTRIEMWLEGRYVSGKQSVLEYLRQTAIVNPHATIIFNDPDGKKYIFQRATDKLPPPTREIRPHPYGIELGMLINMAKSTKETKLLGFLKNEFNRISDRVAKEICEKAWLSGDSKPQELTLEQYKQLLDAMSQVRIQSPPTDCLSPIGETLIRKGLKNVLEEYKPEFYAPPVTRQPRVYSGNPFVVEAGIVYGGNLPCDQPVTILRFANRVPLLYQQGACVITKAIETMDWRRYGFEQRGGEGIPYGPAIILVHVASTKIPFTSEAKEAIANIPEFLEEIQLALKACARKLKTHLHKKEMKGKTRAKFEIVQEILPLIAEKCSKIVGKEVPSLKGTITKIMNVVWIEDSVTYENNRHRVKITVYNYTPKTQSLLLHVVVPAESLDTNSILPKPSEIRENSKLTWKLDRIPSTDQVEISFELVGLDADSYDENEIYVSGINPVLVIGADPLPGDWDLEDMKIEEIDVCAESGTEQEEEEEIDYDEEGEVLSDE